MKVLVTGSSGFLGRHLTKKLESEGQEVVALNSKECDLTQQGSLERKLEGSKFEHIYHLATYTRAGPFCAKHPGEMWVRNQKIDTNALDFWREKQPQAKMTAIGSSCAYDPSLPFVEENYLKGTPLGNFFSYGNSKRMLLVGLQSLNKEFGLKYNCPIPTTLYGPDYHLDGRPLHFVYDLMRKIIRAKKNPDKPVVLWGDGSQEREIIHVNDFINIMEGVDSKEENQLYNLGSGKGYTIKDFAQMICGEVGYDFSEVQFDTTKNVGAKSKVFPLDKMKKLYGKEYQEKDMSEGIKESVSWMLEHKDHFLSNYD
ncbi:NAD-dependent epimerase/dehydratase family protein [Nanoarchaeota archaeon]